MGGGAAINGELRGRRIPCGEAAEALRRIF